MSSRRRSIRFRITTLLLVAFAALTPLWVFAVYLTVPDVIALDQAQARNVDIGVPIDALDTALSDERKATAVYLANPDAGTAALRKARAATDKAAATFRGPGVDSVHRIGTDPMTVQTNDILGRMNQLARERSAIDAGEIGTEPALSYYGGIIEHGLRLLNTLTSLPDSRAQSQGEALSRLTRSRLVLEEMDARASAAIAAGTMTGAQRYRLSVAIGAVSGSYDTALPNLPPGTVTAYRKLVHGNAMATLSGLERRLIDTQPGHHITVTADEWNAAIAAIEPKVHALELQTATALGDAAKPIATTLLIRASVATLFGLAGVVALIVVSLRIGRNLIREITRVRNRMDETATTGLPEMVQRLRAGETVDVERVAAQGAGLRLRTRELDDLGGAFARVHRVAVHSADGEARLRQGVSEVFVNLSRRNQSLLHRQLKLLDELERKSSNPEQLSSLFSLDHLATRMRRHAESLIILSGGAPGRGWSHPVPVLDVVRSAVTEIEDYPRVTVYPLPAEQIVGSAVADVIHLLAELVENAALYSPADAPVQVRGIRAAHGLVVEIEDAGVSMSDQTLTDLNRQLADPPEFDLTDASQLGLFVVGRLAARRGIRVSLRPSPYGGTSAVVLLPESVLHKSDQVTGGDGAATSRAPELPFAPPPNGFPGTPPAVPGNGKATASGRHAADTPDPGTAEQPQPSTNGGPTEPPTTEPATTEPVKAEPARTEPARFGPGRAGPVRAEAAGIDPLAVAAGSRLASDLPSLGVPPLPQNPLPMSPHAGRPTLPRRTRQANIAPQLRGDPSDASWPAAHEKRTRTPEEARAMMSAIQQGWAGKRPDIDHRSAGGAQENPQND
jgi:signal transduction histidine kinase